MTKVFGAGRRPFARLRRRPVHLLVVAVYLVSIFAAVRGADFGRRFDEPRLLDSVRSVLANRTLLPGWYNYPSAAFALATASLVTAGGACVVDEVVRGDVGPGAAVRSCATGLARRTPEAKLHRFQVHVRSVFAVVTLLAVFWVYLLVWWWRRDWREALLAAAILGFSWEVGYQARWIQPDNLHMMFGALTMLAIVGAWTRGGARSDAGADGALDAAAPAGSVESGHSEPGAGAGGAKASRRSTTRWLLAAAVMAGLACGSKYPGGLFLLPVLLAIGLDRRLRPLSWRLPAGAVALFAAAFFVTTPGALLEPGRFVEDVVFEMRHYGEGHGTHGMEGAGAYAWAMAQYLSLDLLSRYDGIALAFAGLALLGGVSMVRRDGRRAAVYLSFPVAYFAYFSTQTVLIVRNFLVFAPFLAVLAAWGAGAVARRLPWRPARLGWAAALVAACALNASFLVRSAYSFERWIEADPGEEIAAYLSERPETRFVLSPRSAHDLRAAGIEPPGNVAGTAAGATHAVVHTTEAEHYTLWQANRRELYDPLPIGPHEVNFAYFPTWREDRVLIVPVEEARKAGVPLP